MQEISQGGFAWPGKLSYSQRVLLNCANLIGIVEGEVIGDRTLGIDPTIIDRPLMSARSLLYGDISDLIADREPRAIVETIRLSEATGEVNMKVVVSVA
jgi:hypothetical protein